MQARSAIEDPTAPPDKPPAALPIAGPAAAAAICESGELIHGLEVTYLPFETVARLLATDLSSPKA